MRCESCESDVLADDAKRVVRAELSAAVARGFGPWGDAAPSLEWPQLVRRVWWSGQNGPEDATLCPACSEMLHHFKARPDDPREWLKDIRESLRSAGLRPLRDEPLSLSPEAAALAQQLTLDLAAVGPGKGATLKGGFEKHGENYGLAAASVLLHTDRVTENFHVRQQAANLLAEWKDPRATAYLLMAMDHPGDTFWIARSVRSRGDINSLLPALDHLAELLLVRHRYTAGEPPLYDEFPLNMSGLVERHPDIGPRERALMASSMVSVSPLVNLVVAAGGADVARTVLSEIYMHSLFREDVVRSAAEMCELDEAPHPDPIALAVALRVCTNLDRATETLARHQTPAAWWAMDPESVREHLAKMTEPDDASLRRVERGLGRIAGAPERKAAAPAPPEAEKKSTCFIATAAYGSEDHAVVAQLRTFRDDVLRRSRSGRAAIRVYERMSPPIARVVASSPPCRALVRLLIQSIAQSRPQEQKRTEHRGQAR